MIFSSSVFILAFLPVSLLLYYISPGRMLKNSILLLLSLAFYAWGDPTNLELLVGSIIVNWLLTQLMARADTPPNARSSLLLSFA